MTQPEIRPISQEQLNVKAKGIYAGLAMVEAKGIEVDNKHASKAISAPRSSPEASLNKELWQALIALHRTLLHEHHDFFLASQRPPASTALRKLTAKYAVPAQISNYSITILDHMLAFRSLAYSMMPLLRGTSTSTADQSLWLKSKDLLVRNRMVIDDHDNDLTDREVNAIAPRNLQRIGDLNVLPFIHVTFVFMLAPCAIEYTAQPSLLPNSAPKPSTQSLGNTVDEVYEVQHDDRTSQTCHEGWASSELNFFSRNNGILCSCHIFTHQLSKKLLFFLRPVWFYAGSSITPDRAFVKCDIWSWFDKLPGLPRTNV
jgi:hypothetical protein